MGSSRKSTLGLVTMAIAMLARLACSHPSQPSRLMSGHMLQQLEFFLGPAHGWH